MLKYLKLIIFIPIFLIILSCVEKKTYSGKFIDENFKYDLLLTKSQVKSNLGEPIILIFSRFTLPLFIASFLETSPHTKNLSASIG